MSYPGTVANAWLLLAILVAGLAFGFIYFDMLRRTVNFYSSRHSWFWPTVLTFGRIAGAAILFSCAAKSGAVPLLAACLGFLLARAAALYTLHGSG
jgi:F1-F0 ATPase (N-ATPase) AtpR subunit